MSILPQGNREGTAQEQTQQIQELDRATSRVERGDSCLSASTWECI